MPWFRLDDSFDTHPKVIAAGNEAIGLYIRCGTYAARNLTDGAVPRDIADLYGGQTLRTLADGRSETLAGTLVRVGLWHRRRTGWMIHDYLDYNPSREDVLNKRRVRAEAGRKGGVASGKSRSKNEANASALVEPPSRPVPGFTADVVTRSNGSRASPAPETIDAVIGEIWDTTHKTVTDEWAARVAADILQGRTVASPAAYVRQAIRKEPRRFLPTSQPPPVSDVLPPHGRHARKDTST